MEAIESKLESTRIDIKRVAPRASRNLHPQAIDNNKHNVQRFIRESVEFCDNHILVECRLIVCKSDTQKRAASLLALELLLPQ